MKLKWKKKYGNNITEFAVGDTVTVAIPQADRTTCEAKRLPVVIHGSFGEIDMRYALASESGLLKGKYRAGDLQPHHASIIINTDRLVSLREAARLANPTSKFLTKKCNCTGSCNTKRCTCIKQGIKCSTHCHPSHACQNKECFTSSAHSVTSCKAPKLLGWLQDSEIDKLERDGHWITDIHIKAVCELIKSTAPHIEGMYDPVLQQNLTWPIPTSEFVQIVHVDGNHWITVSNIGASRDVNIFDSMHQLPSKKTTAIVCDLLKSDESEVKFNVMHVDRQIDCSSCGLYAIAFAASLVAGEDPTLLSYDHSEMRHHLCSSLRSRDLSPFPSSTLMRRRNVTKSTVTEIFCQCRKPDDGRLMVCCDHCNEWYHGQCVGIKDKSKVIDCWLCTKCKK